VIKINYFSTTTKTLAILTANEVKAISEIVEAHVMNLKIESMYGSYTVELVLSESKYFIGKVSVLGKAADSLIDAISISNLMTAK
jgi:hypothetical protein